MMRGLVLLFGIAACARGAELDDPQLAGPFVLHAGTPEPEPCGMAFDPAPELAEATQRAADRWSAATGCDVRVEAGGVPVALVTGLVTASGKRAAGAWRHTGDGACKRVDIDDQLGGPTTVAHELGHCLAGGGGHPEGAELMGVGAPEDRIDDESLATICAAIDCTAFNPER